MVALVPGGRTTRRGAVGALPRCGRSPREAAGNIVARASRMLAEAR
jgi:hypothetical protein